mmetsp:Transcript_22003/g.34162  ORF Transcript_22003/g.34162 Transcript_22003/m.34162 type:complete len:141 (+) Transcript_22003:1750-2172(+)
MLHDVDEFRTRHTIISTDINETFKIGNRLLSFLEKQIIIDYLLRGELEKMEADFPHLKESALKFLGYETYCELAVKQSTEGIVKKGIYVPLGPQDPMFKMLMEKQQRIIKQIEQDFLVHHIERDENPYLPNYLEIEKKRN